MVKAYDWFLARVLAWIGEFLKLGSALKIVSGIAVDSIIRFLETATESLPPAV